MRLDPRRTDLPTNKCVVAVSDVDIDLTKKQYVHHAPFLILLHFMQTCRVGGICSHASHSLSLFTRTPLCSLSIFLHCLSISLCPLTPALTHTHRVLSYLSFPTNARSHPPAQGTVLSLFAHSHPLSPTRTGYCTSPSLPTHTRSHPPAQGTVFTLFAHSHPLSPTRTGTSCFCAS